MEGLSFRKIAKLLGRNPSSISREIARNSLDLKARIFLDKYAAILHD